MAQQIEDLMKDISQMSDEELKERILELRKTRNIAPKVSTKSKDRPANKGKSKDTMVSLIGGMSEEEKQKLLAKLLGG